MPPDYTCMVVDDEQDAIDYLLSLIHENCPFLKVVATANRSADAAKKYFKTFPDLVFLDIEVDEKNGFEIIQEIYNEKWKPHIIFVTAFNRYAIEAFKANALGYLLKPVQDDDLKQVMAHFLEIKETENYYENVLKFIAGYAGKIRFNTTTGFILLQSSEILYCEADHNYTKIFTAPEKFTLVTVNLAQVEEKLNMTDFYRISRAILINSRYLTSVHRRNKTCTLHWQEKDIVLPGSEDMIKKL
jgi:two-component system LytT family response regulator